VVLFGWKKEKLCVYFMTFRAKKLGKTVEMSCRPTFGAIDVMGGRGFPNFPTPQNGD